MDCVENINDWADVLSEDLNKISEIDAIAMKLKIKLSIYKMKIKRYLI